MSRAFVRESDIPQLPELPAQVSPLPAGTKNYLTPGGAQRLRAELARLTQERLELSAAARDEVDAKQALHVITNRIRYLQESLRTAEITAAAPPPHDTVRFGATVTVREATGPETRYRIVGVDETDIERNEVSWLSPIARALLNARLGERVLLKAPRGTRELEIVAVTYEH